MNQIILGIDIGSTKICSIIAEIKKDGTPFILGSGIHKADGIKKGSITNIELASLAIRNSVNDAKRVADEKVDKAIISLSGAYTKSIRESAVVNVPSNEIGLKEINRVMQTAIYNAVIPEGHTVIHALPYEFRLDDQSYAEDPMGMSASRLEAFVHIVTAKKSALENLKRAVRESGIEIENIVLSAYASSIAVLSNEEKELGVVCIDMGGQTCDLMIYSGYSMRYSDFLSVGSHNITIDLATALNTHPSTAEQIKTECGKLILSDEDKTKAIKVPIMSSDTATTNVNLEIVHAVLSARVEETLQLLAKSIEKSGLRDKLGAGIALTGGMANLDGMQEFASSIFRKPVRISKPMAMNGLFDGLKGTHSATAIGLILHGAGQHTNYEMDYEKKIRYRKSNITTENNDMSNIGLPKDALQESAGNTNIIHNGDFSQIRTSEEDKHNNFFVRFYKWASQLF
ncbi:cell division protein FtsA [Helicobacter sp. MIT 03-1614]|uniref:Cell division protein FtsA n=1 Tax=Helicobacter hepaticus (strain ATCC 51449 / 3B1) TaxID=235279 RepID=Q7VI29_HELHP|nr:MULTISPECIES: cell division protein FtsA [Helicobacter]AAP77376.1 cell division protein FtsA [Helicobacter hepaticus ATCC 51449]TLD90503.1 cell division protein FtsA [Helicobacter sp. MIT 03-1614]